MRDNVRRTVFASPLMLASGLVQAQSGAPAWDWPGPWHMGWGGWGFWWIFPLLMCLFIFVCVLFMMGWLGRGHVSGDTTSSALRLLNERFAKGEISRQELEEKRTVLGGGV